MRLLLEGSLLGSLGGSALGTLAELALVVAGLAEGVESLERLLVLGDRTGLLGLVKRWEGEGVTGDAGGEVVTLLRSVAVTAYNDELLTVASPALGLPN